MADKEYVKDLGASAATAMRLTLPWRNSGRIVILNSAFASLKAAKALAGVHNWECKNSSHRVSKTMAK